MLLYALKMSKSLCHHHITHKAEAENKSPKMTE